MLIIKAEHYQRDRKLKPQLVEHEGWSISLPDEKHPVLIVERDNELYVESGPVFVLRDGQLKILSDKKVPTDEPLFVGSGDHDLSADVKINESISTSIQSLIARRPTGFLGKLFNQREDPGAEVLAFTVSRIPEAFHAWFESVGSIGWSGDEAGYEAKIFRFENDGNLDAILRRFAARDEYRNEMIEQAGVWLEEFEESPEDIEKRFNPEEPSHGWLEVVSPEKLKLEIYNFWHSGRLVCCRKKSLRSEIQSRLSDLKVICIHSEPEEEAVFAQYFIAGVDSSNEVIVIQISRVYT